MTETGQRKMIYANVRERNWHNAVFCSVKNSFLHALKPIPFGVYDDARGMGTTVQDPHPKVTA